MTEQEKSELYWRLMAIRPYKDWQEIRQVKAAAGLDPDYIPDRFPSNVYGNSHITTAGYESTHDYCCGTCAEPMKKVSWNAGNKTNEYWYCKNCKKEEGEMPYGGKWIAKPVKEDQDGPREPRQLDEGFFRNQDWLDDMAKRRADKIKPQP